MPLTLLLLIFLIIPFISALALIFMTVKKGNFLNRPYLQSFIHRMCSIFYELDIIFNKFLFITT